MTGYISQAQAEANAYWADKEFKKFVVTLERGPQRKPIREILYVRARTAERAVACAIDNAMRVTRPTRTSYRLMTARDFA